jgi:asparagine synthase (glutamine-hydrolysing)
MSVQFGKCNFDGRPVDRKDFDQVRPVLAPYGPDGEGYVCRDNLGILYRAFHTTKESRKEVQPYRSPSGAVITWDGRLDNREELIRRLAVGLPTASTDVDIVAAAYECWGCGAFPHLVGDWALSVWNPKDQSLVLAKDFVGTRHLYFTIEKDQLTWCTILDPLVLFAGHSFRLEEEYVAGWLSFFPDIHLTPYVGIRAVPASSFVRLARGVQKMTRYWRFDPAKRIRYRSDAEYEEHFRVVFSESVRRRLRSDSPVLAELSGGLDSSSIVCVADRIGRLDLSVKSTLETISYYDNQEPNWDERPYFTQVEMERGRKGFHIDVGGQEFLAAQVHDGQLAVTPKAIYLSPEANEQFATCIRTLGNRVILCGIGGDEVSGGVPTPTPELQDLLARGHFWRLARQLKVWALQKRQPWLRLLGEAASGLLPPLISAIPKAKRPVPWLNPSFAHRNRLVLQGYPFRIKLFGRLPSFQENIATFGALQRQLACESTNPKLVYETRYPYLDRGLLEFLFALPRDQLVRPGQRRSLMRRSLLGIVPKEILDRRRKAYVARTPMAALSRRYASLTEMTEHMSAGSWSIVDPSALRETLQKARDGCAVSVVGGRWRWKSGFNRSLA